MALQTIPFYGDEIVGGVVGGEVFVPLKRLCENLGVTYSRNLSRLRSSGWAVVRDLRTTGKDGKTYSLSCIDTATLTMWLAHINYNDSRYSDIREKLLRYQKEACVVLKAHFLKALDRPEDSRALAAQVNSLVELVEAQQAMLVANEIRSTAQIEKLTEAVQHVVTKAVSFEKDIKTMRQAAKAARRYMESAPGFSDNTSDAVARQNITNWIEAWISLHHGDDDPAFHAAAWGRFYRTCGKRFGIEFETREKNAKKAGRRFHPMDVLDEKRHTAYAFIIAREIFPLEAKGAK
jgi:hypothetical protein